MHNNLYKIMPVMVKESQNFVLDPSYLGLDYHFKKS